VFDACTWKMYATPFVNPVTVNDVAVEPVDVAAVHVDPPLVEWRTL
jgi:hypothetical protein